MTDKTPYDRRSPMEHERDDATPLRNLIEAVEAGDDALVGGLPRPHALATDLLWKAYNGSLDAAKALHDALLGDVNMDMSIRWGKGSVFALDDHFTPFAAAWHNPARAWLLAILRAYEAQQ